MMSELSQKNAQRYKAQDEFNATTKAIVNHLLNTTQIDEFNATYSNVIYVLKRQQDKHIITLRNYTSILTAYDKMLIEIHKIYEDNT